MRSNLLALATALLFQTIVLVGCEDSLDQSAGGAADQMVAANRLQFLPEQPVPGDVIQVSYRPIESLAGERSLVLRARMRSAGIPSFAEWLGSITATKLTPDETGTYTGSFELPGDIVYAMFAVEDSKASEVDTNRGEFWSFLMHDPEGRPLFDALEQRRRDYMGWDARKVLDAARETTDHYPDRALSWYLLKFSEDLALGPDLRSERAESHLRRLDVFNHKLSTVENVDAEQAYGMLWYALSLNENKLATAWLKRLRHADPNHPTVVQIRINELFEDGSLSVEAALGELEALWMQTEVPDSRLDIARGGLAFARRSENRELMIHWARRFSGLPSFADREYVAVTLSENPATWDMGIEWLKLLIEERAALPDDARTLGDTRTEFAGAADRNIANLRTALGKAQLANGDIDEALENLQLAATSGWDSDRFEALAAAHKAKGDEEAAAFAYAAALADPGRSVEASLPEWLAEYEPEWSGIVARVKAEMLERTVSEAGRSRPLSEVRIVDQDGAHVTLDQLAGSDATVVVFWSHYCGPSAASMPRVAELSALLSHMEVPLLAITSDPDDAAISFLEQQGLEIRVLFDPLNEAKNAFDSWATPQYFVLDGEARIRFGFTRIDDLMRQVVALRSDTS